MRTTRNASAGKVLALPADTAAAPGATPDSVRAEMEAAGLSIAQAAREMGKGVSSATLSKWLRGVYEGDVDAVGQRVAAWIETRRDRTARGVGGVDRNVHLGVSAEIEAVLAHAQAAGDVVLIHGRSGAGKSWACERYCRHRTGASRVMMTGAVITLAGLLSRISAAVGTGGRHPSALAAETAIVNRLHGRGALLVIDEAHHLNPRLLDELRCIRDLSGAGLALVGGDELWTNLASSVRCDQIVGRIGIRLPFGAPAEADAVELAQALMGRALSRRERKVIVTCARGAGGLHALRRLLVRAWIFARGETREAISASDLAMAAGEGVAA